MNKIPFKFCSSFIQSSLFVSVRKFSNQKLLNLLKDMPRDAINIAQLQKQRNKIREKAAKYPPGTVNMQFLCSSSTGKNFI